MTRTRTIATESTGDTMSIAATGNASIITAAIAGTTSTIGGNTNTAATGAHGRSGTGMPESIPAYTNMEDITATTPI